MKPTIWRRYPGPASLPLPRLGARRSVICRDETFVCNRPVALDADTVPGIGKHPNGPSAVPAIDDKLTFPKAQSGVDHVRMLEKATERPPQELEVVISTLARPTRATGPFREAVPCLGQEARVAGRMAIRSLTTKPSNANEE